MFRAIMDIIVEAWDYYTECSNSLTDEQIEYYYEFENKMRSIP